ncbi:MAG TPA: hypothetical protein VGK50_04520 [Coriobacteriia bacterium]|jgi:hypothetical protein
MRVEIQWEGDTLVVHMPAPRAPAQVLIAVSWVPFVAIAAAVVWVAAGTFATLATHGVTGVASGVFFLIFALLILGASVVGLGGSLYGLLGSEVARVEGGRLTLERVLFGAKQRQSYRDVGGLGLADQPEHKRRWTAPPPKLRFESDGHGQAFGAGLTDAEATEVLAALRDALG